MTAEAFERLLYTDCRAGTGRSGGGGFQVQAQSGGVDSAQARMAVGGLLYEVQNAWIVQRRPVEDFPLGFAHAREAGYGTAQSRYLGKEASGGRPGNHLADCLLTRDPDRYGAIRPAQLWRSPLWRAEPWDTRECPPFTGELPLGPLTVDGVTEWLRGRPERPRVLARLLSVLEDPAGRRIVIVTASAEEALRWIAAATLLLPVRLALDVSFKVFSSNPLRAAQRIVAVPQELNKQLSPGRGDTVLVLDADECAFDDVEVSGRAGFFAGRLADVDDPFDVIDAVELAAALGDGAPLGDPDAMLTAWALTRPADPVSDLAALFRWLSAAAAPLQHEHGAAVASLLLGADPPASVLRWIDDATTRGIIALDPEAVRLQLLSAELAQARDGNTPLAEGLTTVPLSAEGRRDAESELSSAILLGSDAQVNLLLQLARRHGIEPELAPPLQRRLEEFVAGWLDRSRAYHPDGWARSEQILDLAYDALRDRLIGGGVEAVRVPLRRLLPYLIDRRGDPTDPLDRHLRAAALAALPSRARPAQLRALLAEVAWSQAGAAGLQEALLEWDAVGPAEADLLASDRHVTAFVEAAGTEQFLTDTGLYGDVLARLDQASPAVVELRLEPILRACLECDHPDLGGELLSVLEARKLQPSLAWLLIERWRSELGTPDHVRAVTWGVGCLAFPKLPAKRRDQIADALRYFGTTLSPADQTRWYQEIRSLLPEGQQATWAEIASPDARARRNLRMTRDGGRS